MEAKKETILQESLRLPEVRGERTALDGYSETKTVVAKMEKIKTAGGIESVIATWVCDPKYRNRLLWPDGSPVLAVEVHYSYGTINWSAGQGWPYYHVPQPLGDRQGGFMYPNLPRHCIVWEFGGIVSQTGLMVGGDRGTRVTEVFVLVNDDKYDDNVGSFVVNITAYSQV